MINIFKKKRKLEEERKEMEMKDRITGDIDYGYIYANDYINIIHDACSICYGRNTERTYEERRDYVRRRSNHESISEHSNIILYYKFTKELLEDVLDVVQCFKYLNYKIRKKDDYICMLVGGSSRGYKEAIRAIENTDNKFYRAFLNSLYYIDKCLMEDFIKDEILNEFDHIPTTEEEYKPKRLGKTTIVNLDNMDLIEERIKTFDLPFTTDDLMKFFTITIKFEEVSRAISQQLIRHRAGVTQASQRYINYSDAKFYSPDMFKPEKYDKNKKYEITFKGTKKELTLQELGQAIISIYPQMIEQGLLKEDARAFLPNNTETSLYMTFTLWGLIKFLELRTDAHAQKEIQLIALELEDFIKDKFQGKDIYYHILPAYKKIPKELEQEYDNIDEVIE